MSALAAATIHSGAEMTSDKNPGRFGPGSFRPGSFRPGSFRPNLGVGRFGLGRWVDSALGRFGQR